MTTNDDWFNEQDEGSSQEQTTQAGKERQVKDSDWFDSTSWGYETEGKPPLKKQNKLSITIPLIVLGMIVLGLILFVGLNRFYFGIRDVPYEQSVFYEIENIESDIQNVELDSLEKYIETSYLAQEWDYFNENKKREDFFIRILANVSLTPDTDVSNASTTVPVYVTHVDWDKVTNDMRDFDFNLIQDMYKEAEITKKNYEFHKELTTLFASYVNNLDEIPLKQTLVELDFHNETNEDGLDEWQLIDDSKIDRLLFSSDAFHNTLNIFGGIATGDIGDLLENPNWVKWQEIKESLTEQLEFEIKQLEKYNKVVTNDTGTVLHVNDQGEVLEVINLDKTIDLEELESLEDSDGGSNRTKVNLNQDDNSEDESISTDNTFQIEAPVVTKPDFNIVNAIQYQLDVMSENVPLQTYIRPKRKETKEWEEWNDLSDEEKEDKKEPKKWVDVPLKEGYLIPYTWIGSYYLQNEYTEGDGERVSIRPELGDGTFERPLWFDTPVVTKMIGSDGKYHDVRVTLTRVERGQDAIDYSVSFDPRNRGFDLSSDRDLMIVEFKVENLESETIKLQSEFTLSDKDASIVARTGEMFNFRTQATIKPKQEVYMQDWFATNGLDNYYLVWGKTFERAHLEMWFRQLMLNDIGVSTDDGYVGENDVDSSENSLLLDELNEDGEFEIGDDFESTDK